MEVAGTAPSGCVTALVMEDHPHDENGVGVDDVAMRDDAGECEVRAAEQVERANARARRMEAQAYDAFTADEPDRATPRVTVGSAAGGDGPYLV